MGRLQAALAREAALIAALRSVRAYAENRSHLCPSARAVAKRVTAALLPSDTGGER